MTRDIERSWFVLLDHHHHHISTSVEYDRTEQDIIHAAHCALIDRSGRCDEIIADVLHTFRRCLA